MFYFTVELLKDVQPIQEIGDSAVQKNKPEALQEWDSLLRSLFGGIGGHDGSCLAYGAFMIGRERNNDPSVRRILILDPTVPPYYSDKPYVKPIGQWGERTLPGSLLTVRRKHFDS